MISIFLLSADSAEESSRKSRYVIVRATESILRRKLKPQEHST